MCVCARALVLHVQIRPYCEIPVEVGHCLHLCVACVSTCTWADAADRHTHRLTDGQRSQNIKSSNERYLLGQDETSKYLD